MKTWILRCFTTFLLLLLFQLMVGTFHLLAQNTSSITGVVSFNQTGLPVAYANIILQPGNLTSITNNQGQFTFNSLPPGEYSLMISYLGYKTLAEKILVSKDEVLKREFRLVQDIKLISGVEISDHYNQRVPYSKEIVLNAEFRKIRSRDIVEALKTQPNITGIRRGGSNLEPVVRGLKSSQVNVQVNNSQKVEGGCPNRMDPVASHIEANDITRIEIIKGPYALRYGLNLGAIIRLFTEKARPFETFQVHTLLSKSWESNLDGGSEHATVFGGNKTLFFALSGNNRKYGDYQSGNGTEIPSSFRKYNFMAEAGIIPVKNHLVRLTYTNSQGRDSRFPALSMDERKDNTQLYSATWRYFYAEKTLQSVEAKIYYSDVYHEMDNKLRPVSDTVVAVTTVDALNFGGRADVGLNFRKALLHTGFDYENISKDGERTKNLIMQPGLPVKHEDIWQNANIRNLGIFAEYQLSENNFANWMVAARVDFNNAESDPMELKKMNGEVLYFNDSVTSHFVNVSLSTGVTLNLNYKTTLGVSVGRGMRSPDMVERYIILLPVGYDNYDYLGNPQLNPEINHQADVNFKHEFSRLGQVKISGFYSIISQYILGKMVPESEVMPQTDGVLGVKKFENISKAHLYGFELSWFSPGDLRFGGSLIAAYTAGYLPETEKYIIENGEVVGSETIKNDPLPEIQPFETTFRAHYKWLAGRLVPELSLRFVASQNRISEAYGELKTPGFILAGFNVDYQINNILNLSGGVSNLFNENYYEHLNRRIIGSKAELLEPGRIFYLKMIIEL